MSDRPPRTPTHRLVVSVPLDLSGPDLLAFETHPVEAALRAILPLTSLAAWNVLAGDVDVSLTEIPTWPGNGARTIDVNELGDDHDPDTCQDPDCEETHRE